VAHVKCNDSGRVQIRRPLEVSAEDSLRNGALLSVEAGGEIHREESMSSDFDEFKSYCALANKLIDSMDKEQVAECLRSSRRVPATIR